MGHPAADARHDELMGQLVAGREAGSLSRADDDRILDLMSRVWYRMTDEGRSRARVEARDHARDQLAKRAG